MAAARLGLDLAPLALRRPRLAVELARANRRDPRDPAMIPLLDRAIAVRPSRVLRQRRAELLATAGELSAAAAAWRDLGGAHPGATVAQRVRVLEGRLRETEVEPVWLPDLGPEVEPLAPASKRRILHVLKSAAPERWSGFTIRTLQDLRAQREAGLDPVVVTQLGWPREVGVTEVEPQSTFEGFQQWHLDRGPAYRPRSLPPDVALQDNAEAFMPVVREVRPAILHVHSGYRGGELVLAALALRKRFGIPVVYEVRGLFEAVWSSDPRYNESAELYRRRLAFETEVLHEVDGACVISEALLEEIVARGVDRSKLTLIPNGIDPSALDRAERDPVLRSQLGLDGRLVVGYLGNLDHWREGIDVLLRALAELRARGREDVAVLVVGDGTRRDEWERLARTLGLADRVRFTGRVPHEQVAQYYSQMDLFANPRVDERAARLITPLKPYEAMALGLPVLVSDLPALREIVDPPHRGAVAPPGDAAGLADAIARLLDDPAERARLGEAGRDWVRRERTWAANGARYRAAYERILGPLD
ncbi:MAG TPA: glycosyltransferase family 4 protein [Candidatus Limnocylindrales bacterium]